MLLAVIMVLSFSVVIFGQENDLGYVEINPTAFPHPTRPPHDGGGGWLPNPGEQMPRP